MFVKWLPTWGTRNFKNTSKITKNLCENTAEKRCQTLIEQRLGVEDNEVW